jgi:Glycosyl transferase family 90
MLSRPKLRRQYKQSNLQYCMCGLLLLISLAIRTLVTTFIRNHDTGSDLQHSSFVFLESSAVEDFVAISTTIAAANGSNDTTDASATTESLPIVVDTVDTSTASMSIQEYMTQRLQQQGSPKRNNDATQSERILWIKNLEYAYSNVQEMLHRSKRFPSIQQRVKIYMSNWYIPPCDDTARIPYKYTTTTSISENNNSNITLTVQEIALQTDPQEIRTDDSIIDPEHQQRYFTIDSYLNVQQDNGDTFDEVHYMERSNFLSCTHVYCKDTVTNLLPSFDQLLQNQTGTIVVNSTTKTNVPLLYQFGDVFETRATIHFVKSNTVRTHIRYPRIPVLQKVRYSKSRTDLRWETLDDDDDSDSVTTKASDINGNNKCYRKGERRKTTKSNGYHYSIPINTMRMEPIVIKVKTQRHYGNIYHVAMEDTIPWHQKKNMAVFRGGQTGLYTNGMKSKEAKQLSIPERCKILQRCWFTYTHATSTTIDAKLTEPFAPNRNIPRIIRVSDGDDENVIPSDIHLYGNQMSMNELLGYKALIMLEGNDISSGLKWALFSSSIVMMPEPQLTSWSMEEALQPWVHYVPINVHHIGGNGTTTATTTTAMTDTEEKLQWILNNEEKARAIVKASTLWIADLVLHPDVPEEERRIFDEIARRYVDHFVPFQQLA